MLAVFYFIFLLDKMPKKARLCYAKAFLAHLKLTTKMSAREKNSCCRSLKADLTNMAIPIIIVLMIYAIIHFVFSSFFRFILGSCLHNYTNKTMHSLVSISIFPSFS